MRGPKATADAAPGASVDQIHYSGPDLKRTVIVLVALATAAAATLAHGETPSECESSHLGVSVATALATAVRQHYVFERAGAQMGATVEQRLAAYRSSGGDDLAQRLTRDLQSVANDKHLLVRRAAAGQPASPQRGAGGGSTHPAIEAIARVESLPGGIGFIDLRAFERRSDASDARVASAFHAVAGTHALIIDLRENGGGNPDMVALVSAYVLDRPTLLAEMRHREAPAEKLFSAVTPPGSIGGGVPLFLLTSAQTFSAGEGFAFILQHLGRATVVGERTAGAAHAGRAYSLPCGFEAIIPNTAVVLPGTDTDWETAGVKPDVAIDASRALETAQKLALERLTKQ